MLFVSCRGRALKTSTYLIARATLCFVLAHCCQFGMSASRQVSEAKRTCHRHQKTTFMTRSRHRRQMRVWTSAARWLCPSCARRYGAGDGLFACRTTWAASAHGVGLHAPRRGHRDAGEQRQALRESFRVTRAVATIATPTTTPQTHLKMPRLRSTETIRLGAVGA